MNSAETCADKTYDYIRRRILDGEYSAGMLLVPNEIAKGMMVSVIPVREAMIRLKARGLLSQNGRSGCRVASLEPAEAIVIYQALSAIYVCAIDRYINSGRKTLDTIDLTDLDKTVGERHSYLQLIHAMSRALLSRNEYDVAVGLLDRLSVINACLLRNTDVLTTSRTNLSEVCRLMKEYDRKAVERYVALIKYITNIITHEIAPKWVSW